MHVCCLEFYTIGLFGTDLFGKGLFGPISHTGTVGSKAQKKKKLWHGLKLLFIFNLQIKFWIILFFLN